MSGGGQGQEEVRGRVQGVCGHHQLSSSINHQTSLMCWSNLSPNPGGGSGQLRVEDSNCQKLKNATFGDFKVTHPKTSKTRFLAIAHRQMNFEPWMSLTFRKFEGQHGVAKNQKNMAVEGKYPEGDEISGNRTLQNAMMRL